jgi:hypothetical protein
MIDPEVQSPQGVSPLQAAPVPPPDLGAVLRETMGVAKQMAAAAPKRWPPESGALVLAGAAGALIAGAVPGIGEPLRLAGIGAGAFVVAIVSAARHGRQQ